LTPLNSSKAQNVQPGTYNSGDSMVSDAECVPKPGERVGQEMLLLAINAR